MSKLESFLSEQDFDEILAIEPGGNPGDGLIYSGWYKVADQLNFEYDRFDKDTFGYPMPLQFSNVKSSVLSLAWHGRMRSKQIAGNYDAVYIHGSGGFNDIWNTTTYVYKYAGKIFDCPIIVGPQSVFFEESDPRDIFERTTNPTYFFARERYSYDILEPVVEDFTDVELYLSPDTATYLESDDFDSDFDSDSEYLLSSFRNDRESLATEGDESVPSDGNVPVRHEDIAETTDTVGDYMSAIARASEIYTDRLHVGIGSTILGKDVTIYDNKYHKNRGVYEYTLSEYPKTNFQYLR